MKTYPYTIGFKPAVNCPVRQAAFVVLKDRMVDSDKWQRALAHKYLHEWLEEFGGEYPENLDTVLADWIDDVMDARQ